MNPIRWIAVRFRRETLPLFALAPLGGEREGRGARSHSIATNERRAPLPSFLFAKRGEGKQFEWSERSKQYSASDVIGFIPTFVGIRQGLGRGARPKLHCP